MSLIPNLEWGGDGSIGCDIGYGYLHRIPVKQPKAPPTNKGLVPQNLGVMPPPPILNESPVNGMSSVAMGNNDNLTEVPLLVPSQPSTPVSSSGNGIEGISDKIGDLSLTTPISANTISSTASPVSQGVNPVTNSTTPIVFSSTGGVAVAPSATPTFNIGQYNPSTVPSQGNGAGISIQQSSQGGGASISQVPQGGGANISTVPLGGGASISNVPQGGGAGISHVPQGGGGIPLPVPQLSQGGTQSFQLPYGSPQVVGAVTTPSNVFPSAPPTISLSMPTTGEN